MYLTHLNKIQTKKELRYKIYILKSPNKKPKRPTMPAIQRVQEELAQTKTMDDFFGREGIFRNGYHAKEVRTSSGETTIQIPRDRKGEFEPQIVAKYAANTNELEEKSLVCMPRGCPRGTYRTPWPRCTVWMYPPQPSARLRRRCDRWSNHGKIDRWKPSTPSSIWTLCLLSCGGKARWQTRPFTSC